MTILVSSESYLVTPRIPFLVKELDMNVLQQIAAVRLGYAFEELYLVSYNNYQAHYQDPQIASVYFLAMLDFQLELYQNIQREVQRIIAEGLLLEEILLLFALSDREDQKLIKFVEDHQENQLVIYVSSYRRFYIGLEQEFYRPAYINNTTTEMDTIYVLMYYYGDTFTAAGSENEAYKYYNTLKKEFRRASRLDILGLNHEDRIADLRQLHQQAIKDVYKLYAKITKEEIEWVKRLYETQFQVDARKLANTQHQLALQERSVRSRRERLDELRQNSRLSNFTRQTRYAQLQYMAWERLAHSSTAHSVVRPHSVAAGERHVTRSKKTVQRHSQPQEHDAARHSRSLRASELTISHPAARPHVARTDNIGKLKDAEERERLRKTQEFIKQDLQERDLGPMYNKLAMEIANAIRGRDMPLLRRQMAQLDQISTQLANKDCLLGLRIGGTQQKVKAVLQKYGGLC